MKRRETDPKRLAKKRERMDQKTVSACEALLVIVIIAVILASQVNYPPLKPEGWKWGLETESG